MELNLHAAVAHMAPIFEYPINIPHVDGHLMDSDHPFFYHL